MNIEVGSGWFPTVGDMNQKVSKGLKIQQAAGQISCCNPACLKVATVAVPLKKCSKCRTACYCCRECQLAHWPHHKVACKRHQEGGQFASGGIFHTPDLDKYYKYWKRPRCLEISSLLIKLLPHPKLLTHYIMIKLAHVGEGTLWLFDENNWDILEMDLPPGSADNILQKQQRDQIVEFKKTIPPHKKAAPIVYVFYCIFDAQDQVRRNKGLPPLPGPNPMPSFQFAPTGVGVNDGTETGQAIGVDHPNYPKESILELVTRINVVSSENITLTNVLHS